MLGTLRRQRFAMLFKNIDCGLSSGRRFFIDVIEIAVVFELNVMVNTGNLFARVKRRSSTRSPVAVSHRSAKDCSICASLIESMPSGSPP